MRINLRIYVNRGLGHSYVKELDKVCDIIPILCEKKEFPPHTTLRIYEEVKPSMIEKMKSKWTFQQAEIQNGDIICFQKDLTDEISHKLNAAAFYESLYMRIVVQFKQKYKDQEQKPEFNDESTPTISNLEMEIFSPPADNNF
ncbi:cysteine proteinase [Gigaspora margarita]|uniref:Cysteine proteinase n=1 Tax=Gigaspora margarita TaxID=4874 RepID=A0A8H4ELC4_GIGMA|nr:cysteine proteinase [Gigaspora margarita]